MAFVERIIRVTFTLPDGATFTSNGSPSKAVSHLKTDVKVSSITAPGSATLTCSIYGMLLSDMLQISTMGATLQYIYKCSVLVEAGDAASGMSVVYVGGVFVAYPDFSDPPNPCLRFQANASSFYAVQQANPSSFPGKTDVADVLRTIAQQMGIPFEANGVSVIIDRQYYQGSPWEQAKSAAKAAGIDIAIDKGILIAIPKNGYRLGGGPIPVNADTGMIGYPAFAPGYIIVKTLYNPAINYLKQVEVTSVILPKSVWNVYYMDVSLQTETQNGLWEQMMQCYVPGSQTPGTLATSGS